MLDEDHCLWRRYEDQIRKSMNVNPIPSFQVTPLVEPDSVCVEVPELDVTFVRLNFL